MMRLVGRNHRTLQISNTTTIARRKGLTNYRIDQANCLCRTTVLHRQHYRHIFIHGLKKPSFLAKLAYREADFKFKENFIKHKSSVTVMYLVGFVEQLKNRNNIQLFFSLFLPELFRMTPFAVRSYSWPYCTFYFCILPNFARSFRMQISEITYSHFCISQITNARSSQLECLASPLPSLEFHIKY